jgi:hypothetical protein
MYGKPQKIGLQRIDIIIEITAPSQKIERKIDKPEYYMVQGGNLELCCSIYQEPIFDLFLKLHLANDYIF